MLLAIGADDQIIESGLFPIVIVSVEKCEEQGMVIETQQGPKVNPWFTTKQNCVKQAMQLGQLIGVTPSARARIPNTNQKPVSKLELLKSKSA